MADLGTITNIYTPPVERPTPRLLITDYDVVRGRYLGEITPHGRLVQPELHSPLTGYVVRQIRVLFRQLWPNHGQRFPQ